MTYWKFPRLADPALNPGSVIYQSWANQLTLLNFTFLSKKWDYILFIWLFYGLELMDIWPGRVGGHQKIFYY